MRFLGRLELIAHEKNKINLRKNSQLICASDISYITVTTFARICITN